MPIDALSFLVARTILSKITTYREFFWIIGMQEVTIVATGTSLLDPVHTNKLFSLLFIHVIIQALMNRCVVVDA